MSILFKNGFLLDFDKEELIKLDILVDGDKIKKIDKNLPNEKYDDVVDLKNNIVMPAFANCFYRSIEGYKNSYLNEREIDKKDYNIIKEYIEKKNALAGVCFSRDFSFEKEGFIEDILSYSENELDEISINEKNKIFIKIGQTLKEMGEINSLSKKMPSEYLEGFGFLDKGAVIVGGNCFEKDELELFASYDTQFVLLPNDDARSGRRFANINSLQKYDIPFALGSGDFAEIDFFAFMRQILSYNSFVMENVNLLSEKELLKIATIDGAKILGFDGEIKEGNFANFIVLNSNNILGDNIFKAILFELSKNDVLYTVKNGKILQQNGVFVMEKTKDYAKIALRSKIK